MRPSSSWEVKAEGRLAALGITRIRHKMLVFAVLATLIPSVSTSWISYLQNKRSLEEKLTEELESVSTQVSRELDLWLKERLYDLRVFASSPEVWENLERVELLGSRRSLRRMNDYLNSVRPRIPDYEELLVMNREGNVVATSAGRFRAVPLPANWLNHIRQGNEVIGETTWDDVAGKAVLVVAVPVRRADARIAGALTARLNLGSVQELLGRFAPGLGQAYLMTAQGNLIVNSQASSADLMSVRLPEAAVRDLFAGEGRVVDHTGIDGSAVVGSLRPVPRLRWAVVSEIPAAEAYRQVTRLRNVTVLIVLALLVAIGSIAYFLSQLIVRPLDRLTAGATKVAAGDLTVDVPAVGGGEVAYFTRVFNAMVARLREGREELDAINEVLRRQNEQLERLSVTDGLTGLYNRRHLMQRLDDEIRRSRRHEHTFTLLMIDIDHFKQYNDDFGHLAGDEALAKVGAILKASTRSDDYVARYGGEEFVALLPETAGNGALEVADRIRNRVSGEAFARRPTTLSIGVAEFPRHGESVEAVVAAADAALYEAKRTGRARVTRAGMRLSGRPVRAPIIAVPAPAPRAPAPATSSASAPVRERKPPKKGPKKTTKRAPPKRRAR